MKIIRCVFLCIYIPCVFSMDHSSPKSSDDFSSSTDSLYCICIKNCTNLPYWISIKSGGTFKKGELVANREGLTEWIRASGGIPLVCRKFLPDEEQEISCPFGQFITIRIGTSKLSLSQYKEDSLIAEVCLWGVLQYLTMICLCLYDQKLSIVYA